MVHPSIIESRLNKLGIKVSRWYRPEIKELSLLLMDDEEIVCLVTGRYYGGYALLAATNQRLLLIDKKTMFMSMEDIRFDMISEIDYSARLLDATITIFTVNKQHRFTSVKHRNQMRDLTAFVQKRIMEIRNPQSTQQLAREMDDTEEESFQYTAQEDSHRLRNSHYIPKSVHVPSPKSVSTHLRTVGTAAIRGAHLSAINPYTSSSLMIKRNWSGFHQNPSHVSTKPVHNP